MASRSPAALKRRKDGILSTFSFTIFGILFLYLLLSHRMPYSNSLAKLISNVARRNEFSRSTSDQCPTKKDSIHYAIVFDAGSTGSRIHVYRFNRCLPEPKLEDELFKELKPGLSSYAHEPEKAPHSLDPLLKIALENIPQKLQRVTPLTLKATAGLRLLEHGKGLVILKHVEDYLKTFPFPIPDKGVEIMDGKDEGIYAWITVNYLLGTLGSNDALKRTAAIMDLGGGSTQIVFEPSREIQDGPHKVSVSFSHKKYILYQKSYDGYGLVEARKKTKSKGGCLEEKFKFCVDIVSSHFNKNGTCSISPCSFDGVYMPKLDDTFSDGDIYAFSYFYDVYAEPFGRVQTGFRVGQIHDDAEKLCSKNSHSKECLDLGYIYSLLKIGYELPNSRELKTAKKINGVETGWALGAALALLQ